MIYQFFKRHASNPLVATAAYAWLLVSGRLRARRRSEKPPVCPAGRTAIKAAVICDQMTFEAFRRECGIVFLTPWNWRTVLRKAPPDFLLCESAWEGVQGSGACWRGRIYRNHHVKFEHRGALLAILRYCKRRGIPTVFWNKEDPAFFGSQQYDFVDTALRFDCLFTTAAECVPRYRALGHRRVQVLPFGFSPELFNPLGSGGMRREAFFAGSWYPDQKERCRDMERILRYMERSGVPCVIYDRNYGLPESPNRFPEPYASRCRPGVPYTELDAATKRHLYGLNVNTVRDSQTMFSRRVYELMAGNHMVISGRSKGLEREFPDSVWFCGCGGFPEDDPAARRRNLRHVFCSHTWEKRLDTILRALGMEARKPPVRLYLFSSGLRGPRFLEEGRIQIEYRALAEKLPLEEALPEDAYIAVLRGGGAEADWTFLMTQFAYLPRDCGIRWGRAVYEITEDAENWDCLFPVRVLGADLGRFWESTKKIEL